MGHFRKRFGNPLAYYSIQMVEFDMNGSKNENKKRVIQSESSFLMIYPKNVTEQLSRFGVIIINSYNKFWVPYRWNGENKF